MDYPQDTIAAIATPPGEGAIAIVRVSGPDAFAIADAVFRCHGPPPSQRPGGRFIYGYLNDKEKFIDEVLLLLMRAPHSYTREDMIEIQGHGGAFGARQVLRCVLAAGARSARAGEFTQRAFLNGRMDLLQAEAVLDLIQAQSSRASIAALEQMRGDLSRRVDGLYRRILDMLANLEACLDFPDEDIPREVVASTALQSGEVRHELRALLASWDEGHLLRDGALTVISGQPNVGKSTLMNQLLGSERAIVSRQPGTTRDSIEEMLVLEGWKLRLIDTAGLRESDCEVEQEGIRRTKSHMERADLHLHVIDLSSAADQNTRRDVASLDPGKSILILNKKDLARQWSASGCLRGFRCVETALLHGDGLPALKGAIMETLKQRVDMHVPPHAVISERHRHVLMRAEKELAEADRLLRKKDDEQLVTAACHLRGALEEVGQLDGRTAGEDVLSAVFSRFCIGK